MYFKMKCPHCDKSLKVNEGLVGRKSKCPYCKGYVNVTLPAAPTAQPAPVVMEQPTEVFETLETVGSPLDATPPTPSTKLVTTAPKKEKPASKPVGKAAGDAPAPQKSTKWIDGSNVSLVKTCIIGVVLTAITYGIMLPLRSFYIAQLFLDRGWVPYALVFLFSWSVAILYLKWKKLARQKQSMLFDVLPVEVSDEITEATLDQYVDHIHTLPGEPGESYLLNRVLRGLEHFRVRKSTAETVTMMASQSEIDANNVAGSYALLKVFIWAIPIMGFIGTVIGIGGAVAGFAGSLEGSSDISTLKESLNSVTGGLATAFDTTLIALVMSIVIKFPMSSLQKSEEGLVNWVDEYCNETLLRRLNDGREGGAERGSGGGAGIDPRVFQQAVEAAHAGHQAELEHWVARLNKIGTTLTSQVVEGWEEINARVEQHLESNVQKTQQAYQEQTARLYEQQQQQAQQLQQQLQEYSVALQQQLQDRAANVESQQVEHVERVQTQIGSMAAVADQLQQTLTNLASQTESLQDRMLASVNGSQEHLDTHFSGLERGLTSLSGVLERLGEQQVVVQQVEAPKRGWFRRGNGSRKD